MDRFSARSSAAAPPLGSSPSSHVQLTSAARRMTALRTQLPSIHSQTPASSALRGTVPTTAVLSPAAAPLPTPAGRRTTTTSSFTTISAITSTSARGTGAGGASVPSPAATTTTTTTTTMLSGGRGALTGPTTSTGKPTGAASGAIAAAGLTGMMPLFAPRSLGQPYQQQQQSGSGGGSRTSTLSQIPASSPMYRRKDEEQEREQEVEQQEKRHQQLLQIQRERDEQLQLQQKKRNEAATTTMATSAAVYSTIGARFGLAGSQAVGDASSVKGGMITARHVSGGLRNLGNTCFMNAVLQCLTHIALLSEPFLDGSFEGEISGGARMKGQLAREYARVVADLWRDSVVSPTGLKREVGRWAPQFAGYSQHDAHEFLRFLLDGLHEDMNRATSTRLAPLDETEYRRLTYSAQGRHQKQRHGSISNSMVQDIFLGQLRSTLKCSVCGNESVTFDVCWDLSLELPKDRVGHVTIEDCLREFVKPEKLDGDECPTCERCKKRQPSSKSLLIQELPSVLVIHIKRFAYNSWTRSKISTPVSFPITGLSLTDYCAAKKAQVYDLVGIVSHMGSIHGGHYIAQCAHPVTRNWALYDDSSVRRTDDASLRDQNAYILFYRRRE